MRDLDILNSCKYLKNELTYFNQENSKSHDIGTMSIIIVTRKRLKNRKMKNVIIQTRASSLSSRLSISKKQGASTRHSSMPKLNECTRLAPPRKRSGRGKYSILNKYKQSPFQSKFIVNLLSEHRFDERLNSFNYPRPTKFKIYRCEVGGAEDYCCCSCNSDAMFEIMRSLYECYKKKDCRNCTCILCSHLQPGEKQFSEKEKHLRELAMKGLPLPEGKTASEIKLINKVRTDLGAPIEPTTKAIRDKHEEAAKAGKLLPLEGKMLAEKEKILQDLYDMDIPLPKGRTKSEKALIAKITGKTLSEAVSEATAPSEQMRRARAEGLLTPLKGKTPEEREKILKRLAMKGLPLPEGQTPSENKLIKKVRADLGLPIEPRTKAIRNKHEMAAKAGKLLPLEGKTHAQKEKILKGLHDMDIPLPVGRTLSEKSLIAKIAASPRGPSKKALATLSPSERMRRAKAEGLLTTLKGKTPEEREKILKGLAMNGLPLPEGQTPSENKLIEKVRTELGLPIEPKTKVIRDLHEKAAKAGKLLPLEGKTAAQKEKILKGLHNMDIPLPLGRTISEKSLIAKIAASPRGPSKKALATLSPSEQMRRAKVEGLLTTLKGKTPEEREKILKGLAMKGLPLPEGQTPSENKLIEKVRTELGLPIEPKTKAIRDLHEKAVKAGKLLPLEGKTAAQKENILKGLHDMDIPLPVGRTPSEKVLIAKIAASPRGPPKEASATLSPLERMRRAKGEGLLTTLKGKTPEEREKILKGLAMKGLPLPEGQTPSENKLIEKVRTELGLPIEPKTKAIRDLHEKAAKAGKLRPLEGKTPAQKEKILKGLHDMDIPLPIGRTPSEKALIAKIKKSPGSAFSPSEQLRKAKAEGLLTPIKGKTRSQKENILKGLAMKGITLPEAQSPSEKKLIDKIRADLGLPKDPITKSMKDKHEQAAKVGLLQPLEGKTPAEKEKVLKGLRDMGIPLPEGRTPSEKALIAKVKSTPRSIFSPSEQLRKAKSEGLLTPLKGKTPEQKSKILKGLAMKGIPLPEAQSPSEKKLIDKIRADLGLPKDPTTKSMKEKHKQAAKAGLLQPLEGKTPAEKERTLKGLRNLGIPLPEGRTPSEKALIAKVKASPRSTFSPTEQLRKAKAEGLLTPLKGKPTEQKEKILKGLAMKGLPLPEAQTPSEKKLIDKVRADLGLPKDPTTKSMKEKHELAAKAGLLQPLEGKTSAEKAKILKGLRDIGIPLPEGRTPSEKALIANVKASPPSAFSPSEQLRKAKAEGLLTPLKGKLPEQKENILKGLAMKGLPLPEAQSPSEKKLIDKVRANLGLPKDPTTKSMKEKHYQAAKAGLLQPLEGKTPAEKAKVLKGLRDMGIPLPEGRTPSEKALIAKVKVTSRSGFSPSEQLRKAKVEGLLTPLKGKAPEQKEKILKGLAMKGLPLPEAQSPSEKKLIEKVRTELGLPKDPTTKSMKERHEQAAKAGLLQPLEGKTPAEKERTLKGLRDLGIPLPEGRTPSEEALIAKVKASPRSGFSPSEQLRKAKAEGLLTPLRGKAPEQKEKILKGLAMKGLPLPEAQSPSEKKLIDKVRANLGLPKDPTTKSMKEKHYQAAKAGLLQPLEGKTPAEKTKVLKGLRDMGIPLPEGRTPSEKALIAKVKVTSRSGFSPSEQLRKAKAEGLLTPLKGKAPEQKEQILKGLAMKGLPLPEAQSPSEKKLIDKVRVDLGLPKDPTTKSMKEKHYQAAKAGLLQPLEGKTPAEQERTLKGLRDLGIPLPEGRTPSEKALIAKINKTPRSIFPLSAQLRKAKAEGLLTPLKEKSPKEREKILRGLAMIGLPLPEGQTPSENKLIDKVRADLGLPIEPTTKTIRDLHEKAAKAGKLLPLEGKTSAQKENILKGLHDMDIPLPVGRTPSEKALIAKIKKSPRSAFPLSEQLRKAKAEGLLAMIKGKSPEEKENILRGLAMTGLPLPEGQTPSENKLIDKVRADLGLPIEPTTKTIRHLHEKAAKAGKLLPLEGKTPAHKEKILIGLHDMNIPLPVGRTPSEKALIAKIKKSPRSAFSLSEQLRKAKAEGLLTTLKGKTPKEREKILRGLAMKGLPLPEGQTPSENKLIEKVRTDLGVPIEPKTKAIRDLHEKAAKSGKLLPLEGKTHAQQENILKGLHDMDIPLPVGRTPSEKSLIAKIAASPRGLPKAALATLSLSEQMRRAKAEGLLTTLKGKTPEERENILRGLAMKGLPLPEGQTPSENKVIEKVRTDLGVPIEPKTKAIRDLHEKAAKAGKLLPLEGKTHAQKEKILKGLHGMGIPLPVGRTPSEKALIAKIIASIAEKGESKKQAAGVTEQYEEIVKTTKCDRACGCDKKKIRFKHSYVKIKVTSPDISSFCDCPDECFPRVKSGVFIDGDGIKVTVGTAVGVPSLTAGYKKHMTFKKISSKTNYSYSHIEDVSLKNSIDSKYKDSNFNSGLRFNKVNSILNIFSNIERSSTRLYSTESENIYQQSSTALYESVTSKSDKTKGSFRRFQPLGDRGKKGLCTKSKSTVGSLGSIIVLKSEMSLNSTISNKTMDTISLTSVMDSSITSSTTHFSGYHSTDDPRSCSSSSLEELLPSEDMIDHPATIGGCKNLSNFGAVYPKREYTIMTMSQTKLDFLNNKMFTNKLNSGEDSILLKTNLQSKLDVTKIMNKIISNKRFAGASSIFIVIPLSEDEEEQGSSNCVDSKTSTNLSKTESILKDTSQVDPNPALRPTSFNKRDGRLCRKAKKFYLKEKSSSNDTDTMFQNESIHVLRHVEMMIDEFRQISRPNDINVAVMLEKAVQSVEETTTNTACCCYLKERFDLSCSSGGHYSAKVTSGQKTPLLMKDRITGGSGFPGMHIPPPVASVIQSDVSIACPSVGKSHFSGRKCGCALNPDMYMTSQVLSVPFQSVAADATTNTSCYCNLKKRSDLNYSSGGHYSANVTSEQETPLCLQGRKCVYSLNPDMYTTTSKVFSVPFQNVAADATTNTSCYCNLKERSDQNDSSGGHYSAKVTFEQETPLFLQDKTFKCDRLPDMRTPSTGSVNMPATCDAFCQTNFNSSCQCKTSGGCRLPDMRTPSTGSLHLRVWCDVHTQTSAGSNHIPRKGTGSCRLPDMRTPSSLSLLKPCVTSDIGQSRLKPSAKSSCSRLPDTRSPSAISLVQLRHSSCAMKSNICPSVRLSRGCLPDLRSPSTGPSALPFDVGKQPSLGRNYFPHKTTSYYCLPDMKSFTVSSILQCKVPSATGADLSSIFPNQLYGGCYSLILRTPSTESSGHLSDQLTCSDSHVSMAEIQRHPACFRNNMHKHHEPNHPSTQRRFKETSTSRGDPIFSSNVRKPRNETTTSSIKADYSRAKSRSPQNRRELLSHTIKTRVSASYHILKTSFKTTGPSQHLANQQSYVTKHSADEKDCPCEDIEGQMSIRKLRLQADQKSKMSIYDEKCPCEDNEDTDITDRISNPKPHVQGSRMSKFPLNCTGKEDYSCEDKESTDITGQISSRKPWLQADRKSKMAIYSTNEEDCPCEDIEGTNITDPISRLKPRVQAKRKIKMAIESSDEDEGTETILSWIPPHGKPINSDSEKYCPCDDIEGTNIIDQISNEKSMSIDSASEEYFPYDDVESTDSISDEISNRKSRLQASLASKISISSNDEGDYPCGDKEETDIIPTTTIGGILIRKPRHQSSQKSKMPIYSADGYHCHCEDKEGTNGLSSRQPPRQAIQKTKKRKDFAIKDDFVNKGVERTGITTDETRTQQSRSHSRPKSEIQIYSTDEEDCSCEDIDIITVEISNQRRRFRASHKSKKLIYFTDEENGPFEDMGIDLTDQTSSRKPRLQADLKSKTAIYSTDDEDYPCEHRKDTDVTDQTSSRTPRLQARRKIKTIIDPYFEDNDIQVIDIITDTIPSRMHLLQPGGQSKMPLDSSYRYPCLCQHKEGTNTLTSQKPHFQASQKTKKLLNSTIKRDFENNDEEHSGIITNELRSRHLSPHVCRESKISLDSSCGYPCLCEDKEGSNAISNRKPQFQASQKSKNLLNSTFKGDFENEGVERSGIITNESRSRHLPHHSSRKSKMPTDLSDEDNWLSNDIEGLGVMTNQIPGPKPRIQLSQKSKNLKITAIKVNSEIKVIQHPGIVSDELKNPHTPSQVSRESTKQKTTIKEDYDNQQQTKDITNNAVCVCEEIEERSRVCLTDQVHQQEIASNKKSKIIQLISSIRKSIFHKIDKSPKDLETYKTKKIKIKPQSHISVQLKPEPSPNQSQQLSRESKMPLDTSDEGHCVCDVIKGTDVIRDQIPSPKPRIHANQKSKKLKDSTIKVDFERKGVEHPGIIKKELKSSQMNRESTKKKTTIKEDYKNQKESKDYATKMNCECQHLSEDFRYNVSCECQHLSEDFRNKVNCECQHLSEDIRNKVNSEYQHLSQQIPLGATSVPSVCVYDGYPYEYNCGWIDSVELMRLRSELTETTSGFKACKKRKKYIKSNETIFKKHEVGIELDFEDAIKYYVGKNLEQFQDLIPPLESVQKKAKVANKNQIKQKNKNIEDSFTSKDFCGCPYGSVPPEFTYDSLKFTPEASAELAKLYPKGLKFSLGGTGLIPAPAGHNAAGAPAKTVAALCCYANVQL